jgi:hypothetical protein
MSERRVDRRQPLAKLRSSRSAADAHFGKIGGKPG